MLNVGLTEIAVLTTRSRLSPRFRRLNVGWRKPLLNFAPWPVPETDPKASRVDAPLAGAREEAPQACAGLPSAHFASLML
jgi:hypothetical protein